MPTKSRSVTLRIEPDQFEVLERNRLSYGTPYSEQVRRALAQWLEAGGLMADPARVAGQNVGATKTTRRTRQK
jgi:hypothetical protein